MAIFAAAYDLGLNTLMVRYNLKYATRFPWDPTAEEGRGVYNCQRWLEEDLEVLTSESTEDTSQVETAVEKLGEHLRQRPHSSVMYIALTPRKVDAIMQTWGKLSSALVHALRRRPRLYPWYRLGRAMGFCFLDALESESQACFYPHLTGLLKAATCLPTARVETMSAVKRLATFDIARCLAAPLVMLREALQVEADALDVMAPAASAIHKLARLNKAIRLEIAAVPDGQVLELRWDGTVTFALIYGEANCVSDNQARILNQLLYADGRWLSSKNMIAQDSLLESAIFPREVDHLPQVIKVHIRSARGHHGGYRWVE